MNIGYAMLYPYRGSIQNMMYISELFKDAGHVNFFLKCNASVPACYNRLIKGTTKKIECAKCFIGGIDTFPVKNIKSIDPKRRATLTSEELYDIVASSSFSLHRIETDDDCISPEVLQTQKDLHPLAEIVFENSLNWIEENALDLVFIFNGRLDMPRAVLKACEYSNVPYITFEAAYPGVQLEVNADCRSLKTLHGLVEAYKHLPLNTEQAMFAAKIAAEMLTKRNLVWRLYNVAPEKSQWPKSSCDKKILIVPSSNHEFKGVSEWTPEWRHPLDGVEAVVRQLGASFADCVIRCHPNWSENIGISKDGQKSERVYLEWARKYGAKIILSDSKANTNDLMREADYIIVQYGTAGIEGALLGKRVIGLAPSWYSKADFSVQVHSDRDLWKITEMEALDPVKNVRQALRFLYVFHKRFMRYTNYIKPVSVYENKYFQGASIKNILQAIDNNVFAADDSVIAVNSSQEEDIVSDFMNEDWEKFLKWDDKIILTEKKIQRKLMFRWIDPVRRRLKSGDA